MGRSEGRGLDHVAMAMPSRGRQASDTEELLKAFVGAASFTGFCFPPGLFTSAAQHQADIIASREQRTRSAGALLANAAGGGGGADELDVTLIDMLHYCHVKIYQMLFFF